MIYKLKKSDLQYSKSDFFLSKMNGSYLFPFSKSATNCANPMSVNGCFNNP